MSSSVTINSRGSSVMLVDDHAVVRMGFRLLLETTLDFHVVAEFSSGEEALLAYNEISPDLVVLDLSLGGMSGLEILQRLLAKDAAVRVLVLSAHEDTGHARRALKAGALGYLCKRSAADALIAALQEVSARRVYIDPQIANALAVEQVRNNASPLENLSQREFEIFLMLAHGKSVAEIARTLFLSPSTVGTHLYNIKQKLAAGNAAELTLIAMRNGLLN